MTIVVYILLNNIKVDDEKIKHFNDIFSNPLFKIVVVSVNKTSSKNDEWSQIKFCIEDANVNFCDSHILILQSNTITHLTSNDIFDICSFIISQPNWDLCYLSKWLDSCHLYQNPTSIPDRSSFVVTRSSPIGSQAFIINKKFRDVLLNKKPLNNGSLFSPNSKILSTVTNSFYDYLIQLIDQQAISTLCIIPSLFEFDSSTLTSSDTIKLQSCKSDTANVPIIHEETQQNIIQPSNNNINTLTNSNNTKTNNNLTNTSLFGNFVTFDQQLISLLLLIIILILLFIYIKY